MTDNKTSWEKWEQTKAKYENRLKEEFYIELDNQIKMNNTHVVEELPHFAYRTTVGKYGEGNYKKSTFSGI